MLSEKCGGVDVVNVVIFITEMGQQSENTVEFYVHSTVLQKAMNATLTLSDSDRL